MSLFRARTLAALLVAVAAGARPACAQATGTSGSTSGSASAAAVQVLPDDALGRAMRDELARSVKELKLADLDRPYFIAYRVDEVDGVMAMGTRGTLLGSNRARGRYLTVELRVGDYTFDNTGAFGAMGFAGMRGRGSMLGEGDGELPLDDDYLAIRREIWLATDAAYKQALESLNAKRAAAVNRVKTDSLPDFWRDTATQTVDEQPLARMSIEQIESLVRALSGTRELAALDGGGVRMRVAGTRVRYVSSEGTAFLLARPTVELSASGTAQGTDGMAVAGTFTIFGRSPADLPSAAALAERMRALALHVDSLRKAPIVERYKGPVLFEGRAAAQLFADAFAPTLVGRRGQNQSDVMSEFIERARGGDPADSEKGGAGSRVLPAFLDVVDDPTVAVLGDQPLLGGYKVDDDGVPGRRTRLVEGGVMKAVLATRTPVEGATRSTGNRRGFAAAPSNLIVESRESMEAAELRRRFLAAVQKHGLQYGLVVREIGGGAMGGYEDDPMMFMAAMSGRGGRRAAAVYRVYADGREELLRPMQISGVTASTFKEIVAVSRARTVLHQPVGFGGGMFMMAMRSGGPASVASFAVPAMLFDDVSLSKQTGEPQKPPIIPPPPVATRE